MPQRRLNRTNYKDRREKEQKNHAGFKFSKNHFCIIFLYVKGFLFGIWSSEKMTLFWPCLILLKNKITNTKFYTVVRLVNITKRFRKAWKCLWLLKQLIPLHFCTLRFHIQSLVLSLFGLSSSRTVRQNLESHKRFITFDPTQQFHFESYLPRKWPTRKKE